MVTAKVITVSDRSYRGEREDAGGPAVKALLERAGYTVGEIVLVPDERERIEKALICAADEENIALIVTPKACLSRAAAGIRGKSLIVNLPGSPKGACENLEAVLEPLEHGIFILRGGKE